MTQNTNSDLSPKSLVIMVTGADAAKFLQGQVSCDVAPRREGSREWQGETGVFGGYFNIKGRVEALFTLYHEAEAFYLQMHLSILEPTLLELKKYAVFSKVELSLVERKFPTLSDEQAILAGIPEIYAQTRGMFFPHDLNLPALGAVSFTKGCYRGQEIVARMQYRGNLKRSLLSFTSDRLDLKPGDSLEDGGTVVRVHKNNNQLIGLAVQHV